MLVAFLPISLVPSESHDPGHERGVGQQPVAADRGLPKALPQDPPDLFLGALGRVVDEVVLVARIGHEE